MRAKSFFYVSLGILALAAAYHLGATTATAQQGSMVSGFAAQDGYYFSVLTPNGDVYARTMPTGGVPSTLEYHGNFWAGTGPTPTKVESFGQVKARYRGERAAPSSTPTNR